MPPPKCPSRDPWPLPKVAPRLPIGVSETRGKASAALGLRLLAGVPPLPAAVLGAIAVAVAAKGVGPVASVALGFAAVGALVGVALRPSSSVRLPARFRTS
jgi:hypothetical protein